MKKAAIYIDPSDGTKLIFISYKLKDTYLSGFYYLDAFKSEDDLKSKHENGKYIFGTKKSFDFHLNNYIILNTKYKEDVCKNTTFIELKEYFLMKDII